MASYKSSATWVPAERRSLANTAIMSMGALGVVVATEPTEWLVGLIGWRNAFLVFAALILPVFYWRHYIVDKGQFPKEAMEDLGLSDHGDLGPRRAGMLPYLALLAGLAVVLWSNWFFTMPV